MPVSYLYSGNQAIAELQGSAIGATYLNGLQIDEVLARYTNQGNRTLLTDALGSVIAQSDEAQSSTTLYGYSAYGEQTQVGENNDNSLQYTGRENDNTGLYYYRARYYDPQLKRFISSDPIGLRGGINWYGYVGGSPLLYTDPSGKALQIIVPVVTAALVVWGVIEFGNNVETMADSATNLQNLQQQQQQWLDNQLQNRPTAPTVTQSQVQDARQQLLNDIQNTIQDRPPGTSLDPIWEPRPRCP